MRVGRYELDQLNKQANVISTRIGEMIIEAKAKNEKPNVDVSDFAHFVGNL